MSSAEFYDKFILYYMYTQTCYFVISDTCSTSCHLVYMHSSTTKYLPELPYHRCNNVFKKLLYSIYSMTQSLKELYCLPPLESFLKVVT